MWPVINLSALVDGIFSFKKSFARFALKSEFQPMRVIEFITGHMVYNLAYTEILQTTATQVIFFSVV